ncbi:MAG: hypothetical protein ACK4Z8_05375 [Novosphingobium sp.]
MKAGGAAIAFALALALAGCSKNDGSSDAPAAVASEPHATSSAIPKPLASPQPVGELVLTGAGITGAEVGKAWNEVSGAFEKVGGYSNDEFAEGCDSYFHLSGKFEAMVVDNAIIRIDVTEPGVRTIQGISIGASLADLRQAYGDQLKPEKNPYDGEDIQYVWESKDRGLVFYMRQGKVWLMAGGGEAIRYPEGCH